jgi:hypothetical protein
VSRLQTGPNAINHALASAPRACAEYSSHCHWTFAIHLLSAHTKRGVSARSATSWGKQKLSGTAFRRLPVLRHDIEKHFAPREPLDLMIQVTERANISVLQTYHNHYL